MLYLNVCVRINIFFQESKFKFFYPYLIYCLSWAHMIYNFRFIINWCLTDAKINRFSMNSVYCSLCVALILHCCFLCSVFPIGFQTNAVLILSMNIKWEWILINSPLQASTTVRMELNCKMSQWRATFLLLLHIKWFSTS